MLTVRQALQERPYPGRGCLVARTEDGVLRFVYFLTGRSSASRSRELVVSDNGDLEVRDTSAGSHDSLRHYTALARRADWCVLGNGEQVVPLAQDLAAGVGELGAWQRHAFEPDPPILTPRIWVAHSRTAAFDCLLGIARSSSRGEGLTDRVLLVLESVPAGTGVLLSTYTGTITDVRTAASAVDVQVTASDADGLLGDVWGALDPALRVGAATVRPDDQTLSLIHGST